MTTLKDYMNDMIEDYQKLVEEGKDEEQAKMFVIEQYLVYIKNRLIGE